MSKQIQNTNQFLLYSDANGDVHLEVLVQGETVWLTQQKIADLFGVQRPAISKHLKNIFESNELIEDSVCSKMEHTANDKKVYSTKFYNLDAIISVGYRVNSRQATHFTSWKNSPKGRIRKTDICVAKNYLTEDELDGLNRIVTMYLDCAESQARKGVVMYMKDWAKKLDAFLKFNEEAILTHTGKVSHEVALALAEKEYETYRITQDRNYVSDFDKVVYKLEKK